LEAHGIKVLRFSNEEVENHLGEVLQRIVEATSPHSPQPPLPSPDAKRQEREEGAQGVKGEDLPAHS
jgi:hypothetical protein